jgi:voltage-gated potassium channel
VAKQPHWNTYHDAFQDLLMQGATLLADGNDLGINRKLTEKIPAGAKLYVVCHPDTYRNMRVRQG